MKKIILITIMISCTNATLKAQIVPDSAQSHKLTANELRLQYLKKAKTQKTLAIVSACGGSAIAMIGFGLSFSGSGITGENNYNESKYNTGVLLMYSGAAMVVASIPLAFMSGSNKKKANLLLSNRSINTEGAITYTLISAGIAINF